MDWRRFGPLLAFLLACAAYAGAVSAPFLPWDDGLYVTSNSRLAHAGLDGLLLQWNPQDALSGRFIEFFPLRDTLYWVLFQAFGANPLPFHLVIILLHGVTSALVVTLGWRVRLEPRAAALAGIVFALHPVHSESVAWVACLKDPLFTLFALMALDRAFAALQSGSAQDRVLALLLLVLSLLVKSLAMAVPGIIVVVDVLVLGVPWRASLRRVLPHLLVCGAFVAFFLVVARANEVIVPYPGGSFPRSLLTTLVSYAIYTGKLVVPVGLSALYAVEPPLSVLEPRVVLSAALLVAVSVLLSARARRNHDGFGLCAWLWYVGALLPVVNLVPHAIEVADRYQYLPSVGPCLFWGLLVERGLRKAGAIQKVTLGAAVVVLGLFFLGTVQRVSLWRQGSALFQDALDQPGAESRAMNWIQLGLAIEVEGRPDEALAAYQRGVGLKDARARPDADIARLLLARGDKSGALAHAERAVELNDAFAPAWITLAAARAANGDDAGALRAWDNAHALHIDGDNEWNRGLFAFRRGDPVRASDGFLTAVTLSPSLCARLRAFAADAQTRGADVSSLAQALRACAPPVDGP